ncbi:hypothetical protein [Longispora albida]|uniref:hypothetical protein n=1 Tax=Longispora albida TaxID=203523 RepID=UPI0003725FE4|nr:hypothetical protein [Longispora albida]
MSQPFHQVPPAARVPGPGECRYCGSGPALKLNMYGHVGLVIAFRTLTAAGPFCRDCGIAVFRQMSGKMLYQGWWGPLSLVICPIMLIVNLVSRLRLGGLRAPSPVPGVAAQLPAPMDAGKPLYRRPVIAGLIIPVVAFAAIGVAIASAPAKDCYRELPDGNGELVECSQPHDGRVLGTAEDTADCPAGSTGYLKRDYSGYYCLAEN